MNFTKSKMKQKSLSSFRAVRVTRYKQGGISRRRHTPLAKLPAVRYKIEMVFAGMKTKPLLLFAGRGDFPAGNLPACAARRQANSRFAKTSCTQATLCHILLGWLYRPKPKTGGAE
jgi:hypothetical protein